MSNSKSSNNVSATAFKKESNRIIKAVHKNEGQREVLRAIDENVVTIVSGIAGTGKAQPLTSKIATPYGYKLMSEIAIGDTVCTPDGGTASVTGIFPQGVKKMYRVHLDDGDYVDACPEHLWEVVKLGIPNGKSRILNTEFIKDNIATSSGRRLWAIKSPQPLDFKYKPVEIDPYTMGVLIGDGGLTNSVMLSSADEEILQEVSSSLEENYHLKYYSQYDYKIVKTNRGGGSMYYDALRSYGLFGKKSYEKHIPKEYMYNSKEVRLSLVQGLMDTDGEVERTGGCRFTTTSKQLSLDFKEIVQSLGGVCKISEKKPFFTYNGIRKAGRIAYGISVRFTNHKDLFRLSRKKKKARTTGRLGTRRIISKVEEIDPCEAQCIMIDSPRHLYITDHSIVTHNTFLAVSYGLQMLMRGKYERLLFTRPVVEAGESLGFLPGGIEEKLGPYMIPIFDILGENLSKHDLLSLIEEKKLVTLPLAFMRGITFKNTYAVLDEGQNATPSQVRLFLTRVGEKSKAVITGDPSQSDIRGVSGLEDAIQRLNGVPELEIIHLDASCVVRHPIVSAIDSRYAKKTEGNTPKIQ
jgi:phosphate starvation-inducible protein PhoH